MEPHKLIELAALAKPALDRILHPQKPKPKPAIKHPDGAYCVQTACPWCGKGIHAWYGAARDTRPKENNQLPDLFGFKK